MMGPLWWLFNLQTLFLGLFLGWSYLCFRAGWNAHHYDDLAKWLYKVLPPDDRPPEPPTGARV